jgi:hypothetical protein
MGNNASVLMQDIQFDLGEGLLEGVEISANPLRMEDDVLDDYNEETGEWETQSTDDRKEVHVIIRNKKDLNDYQTFFGVNNVVGVYESLADAYDMTDTLIEIILNAQKHVIEVDDWSITYEDEDLATSIKITYSIETYILQ